MLSLALTSGWYYICTSYCTPNTKQRIEFFKQEKKNTADFMIEFEALAMKVDTDKLHTIFLLKKMYNNI